MIIAYGNVAHLFYNGNVQNHDFKNFHFKAEVRTTPALTPAFIFIPLTRNQAGHRGAGEVQVNNSHTDWRRTGGLYAVQDVKEQLVKDNVWFTEEIIVQGKKVTIKVNGQTTVEYDRAG